MTKMMGTSRHLQSTWDEKVHEWTVKYVTDKLYLWNFYGKPKGLLQFFIKLQLKGLGAP